MPRLCCPLPVETCSPLARGRVKSACCATLVPRTGWRPRPSALRIKVGAPIDPRGLSRDELMARVRTAIIHLNVDLGGPGGDHSTVVAVNEDDAPKVTAPDTSAVAA